MEGVKVTIDLGWLIGVVLVPGLLLLWRNHSKTVEALNGGLSSVREASEHGDKALLKELSDYKLHVAKEYASIGYLKDVEERLTNHLVRIEDKLDGKQSTH